MAGLGSGLRAAAVAAALLALLPARAGATSAPVLEASIEGEINSVTSTYIGQAVERAQAENAAALVVVMNTPGGISTSMDEITTTLLNSRVPVIAFVYPTGARADSAGLFVAQAADLVVMAPGTNLGSAHPIQSTGADLTGDLGKKVVNDAVARIRSLAAGHGRNADWCEQAVRESVNVSAEQAVALHVADLVASDVPALLRAVDGRQARRAHGQTVTLHVAGSPLQDASMSGFQQLLHALFDPNIAYLLMLVAVYGLIAEVSTPGAILPGTVGVIAGVLALVALASLPVNLAGALLVVFAFLLFIADLKAPTHGILTAGGVIALLLGSAFLVDTGPLGEGVSPWLTAAGALVSLAFFAVVVRKVLAARRAPVFAGGETLIGRVGEARQPLAPSGLVFVGGALWGAVAESGAIGAGTPVRVVGQRGLELTVAAVAPAAEEQQEERA